MASTWLPFAIRRPGPVWKVGYGSLLATPLTEKEGEVKHSMEGTLAGALAVLDGPSFASWPLSVPKAGPPLQHYPLEALTWHAGVQGDRRQDTSLIGNLTLIGEEHEDFPTNELNANQIHWSTEISKEVRRLCPRVAARPPTLRVNLWEHNWLSATSCPSELIPWAVIIAGLEDDDMKLRFIQRKSGGAAYVTDGLLKWAMPTTAIRAEMVSSSLVESNDLLTVSDKLFGLIKTTHGQLTAGGGLTKAETKEAAKQAAREGTG